jgi:hypothetical protein
MADWSDFVSDSELVSASQLLEIPKSELVASKQQPSGRFRTLITDNELRVLQLSRFPKKTIDNSTWAVMLFGEWRDQRNRRYQLTIAPLYKSRFLAFVHVIYRTHCRLRCS